LCLYLPVREERRGERGNTTQIEDLAHAVPSRPPYVGTEKKGGERMAKQKGGRRHFGNRRCSLFRKVLLLFPLLGKKKKKERKGRGKREKRRWGLISAASYHGGRCYKFLPHLKGEKGEKGGKGEKKKKKKGGKKAHMGELPSVPYFPRKKKKKKKKEKRGVGEEKNVGFLAVKSTTPAVPATALSNTCSPGRKKGREMREKRGEARRARLGLGTNPHLQIRYYSRTRKKGEEGKGKGKGGDKRGARYAVFAGRGCTPLPPSLVKKKKKKKKGKKEGEGEQKSLRSRLRRQAARGQTHIFSHLLLSREREQPNPLTSVE